MSRWQEVLRVPLEHDLSLFCHYLAGHGINTYVFERNGQQCVCVPEATDPQQLSALLQAWSRGEVDPSEVPRPLQDDITVPTIFARWWSFPATLVLVFAAAVTWFMVATPPGEALGGWHWFIQMTLQPVSDDGQQLHVLPVLPSLANAWRYFTPLLLHFSVLHILFNAVMLIELGRRIEMLQGTLRFLFVVALTGLLSNLAQFMAEPLGLFGGLSGAIYGLMGYAATYRRANPSSALSLPPGLFLVAMVWLLLCLIGVVTWAGLGNVANMAHMGGLAAGLLLGSLLGLRDRLAA